MLKWLAFAVVAAVPVTAMASSWRRWFLESPTSLLLWCVSVSLFLGAIARWLRTPGATGIPGYVFFWAIPLVQATLFVALVRAFSLVAGRELLCFDEARSPNLGGRPWGDLAFWLIVIIGLIIGAAWVCFEFDIDLPRSGAS